jgi:hypothetical protein
MNLYKQLITSALHRNSECLRIILSRDVELSPGLACQFAPDALADLYNKLDSLSACWYLIKPALGSKNYRKAKLRLKSLKKILAAEIDRNALLELLDDLLPKFKSAKSVDLLTSVQQGLQEEGGNNYLDVEVMSVLLQEESRCWRALQPELEDDAHKANKKILSRFLRRYIDCQARGKEVLTYPRSLFPKEGTGPTKISLRNLPVLQQQLPQKQQASWHRKVNALWHQLLQVEKSLGEAGRERNWYLIRLKQCQSRGRLLSMLKDRLDNAVRRGEQGHKTVNEGAGAVSIANKIPGKLLRELHDQQNKLILRQVKLYERIFGQSPKAYLAFVSMACKENDLQPHQLPENQ